MKDKIIGGIIGVTLAGAGAFALTPTQAQETFKLPNGISVTESINLDDVPVVMSTPKTETITQQVSARQIKFQIEQNNKQIADLQAENAELQAQLVSVYEVANTAPNVKKIITK